MKAQSFTSFAVTVLKVEVQLCNSEDKKSALAECTPRLKKGQKTMGNRITQSSKFPKKNKQEERIVLLEISAREHAIVKLSNGPVG